MKTGIFGGSFDPVHIGHLILADRLREAAGLDRVIFMPAYISPFKLESQPADRVHRLEMLRLALKGCPCFEVSDIELSDKKASYTYETLEKFQAENPGDEIYFMLGADAFLEIDKWHRAEELLKNFCFAVGCRGGFSSEKVRQKVEELKNKFGAKAEFYEIPEIELSSSEIRERAASGRSLRFLVPDEVLKYIYDNKVYVNLMQALESYAKEHEKPSRFLHTKGVVEEVTKLSEVYGVDARKAQIAAWFHDTYKPAGNMEHGKIAAEAIQRDFGINDPEIIEAIKYHTTGKPGMCKVAKLLKLADMTEPNRTYPGVDEIRAGVTDDLDESLLMLMKETREYVLSNGGPYAEISNETIKELENNLKNKGKG